MCWKAIHVLVLFATTIVDYFIGIKIATTNNKKHKKLYITCSIIFNLGLLCFFKYTNFFIENYNDVASAFHLSNHTLQYYNIILPLGISFFTFKSMSYTIDIYYGRIAPEYNFLKFATFVAFFPELVAGPIVRAEKLIPQFNRIINPTFEKFIVGLKIFIIGLFKKLFISDFISPYADNVFAHPSHVTGYEVWVGVIAYTIQIYCDFSGYSGMAIGIAKMLDFDFPENFNVPYLARNVTDFWKRWHISMSTWFLDYICKPFVLAHKKWGKPAIYIGIFITFTLSGLWHGAAWHFIFSGVLQFIALAYEMKTAKFRKKIFGVMPNWLHNLIGIFFTVSFFSFTLIFFRSANNSIVKTILHKIVSVKISDFYYLPQFTFLLFIFIFGHILYPVFYNKDKKWKGSSITEITFYSFMLFLIILLAPTHTSPFIYFNF